jgi:hypothetical protein
LISMIYAPFEFYIDIPSCCNPPASVVFLTQKMLAVINISDSSFAHYI